MNFGIAFRMALRGLRSDRVTSLVAVGILALGLAAPATFFSLLWGGGFRPLPVPEGERVVRVEVRQPSGSGRALAVGPSDLEALQATGALSPLGAFGIRDVTVSTRGIGAVRTQLVDMTSEVFELLRVEPLMGRIPTGQDAETGFVMGYEMWTGPFEADPDILGRSMTVAGEERYVSAVMPEGFKFPFRHGAWTVFPHGQAGREGGELEIVGRLPEGVSLEATVAQLDGVWRQRDVYREAEEGGGVVQVLRFTRGRGEAGEAVVFGGLVLVGLCLLQIAVVNAANLLLVRAASRVRALGVQSALGASRIQISSQLLLEALLLAVAGGIVGLGLASIMIDYVQTTMSARNFGYYWMRMAVDGPVVVFTGVLVLGTAVVAGMLPVVRVLRADVQQVLKGGRASAAFESFGGLGRYLVVGQLALSCAALVAAGLTGQAMRTASDFGKGLPSAEVLIAGVTLEGTAYDTPESRSVALERITEALSGVPGVRAAALASGAPGYGRKWGPVEVVGEVYERPRDRAGIFTNAITSAYLSALDLSVVRGRALDPADRRGTERVAMVSESLAKRLAGGGDALGMAVRTPSVDSAWATVVGVVADADLSAGPRLVRDVLYLSAYQVDMGTAMVVLRTDGEPTRVAGALRRAVASVDPELAVSGLQSLEEGHRYMTQAQSTLSSLAVTGGLAGLLVAAVGLFGLLSFRVRQRMGELGVRMALGADGRRLGTEVLFFALRQLLPAVGVGLAFAWIAAPALGALLLGGDPRSATTYAGVATVFVATGMIAALIPALRAAAVEPIEALRSE